MKSIINNLSYLQTSIRSKNHRLLMAEDELEEYNYEKASQLLADLFDYGLTCAEAVDYLAIEKANIRTKEWSNMRNVMHSTVSSNVRKAKEKVEDRDSS